MTKMLLPIPALLLLAACSQAAPSVCENALPVVEDGWARATLADQKMGAAYFSIRNDGDCAAKLVGVQTAIAGSASLHETMLEDGVASMAPIDNVEIKARKTFVFEPGGKHVMLGMLDRQLVAGERFTLRLEFEGLEPVDADIEIIAPGAR